jgi:Secretion system C-terminal sorting domain
MNNCFYIRIKPLISFKHLNQINMKYFTLFAMSLCALTMKAQLVDPSFEGGTDASGWTQGSTNFGTPLCTEAGCGNCGGGCVAYDGEWYAWFGGAGAATEELGELTQVVTIPNGTSASLTFWCVVGSAGDSLATEHVDVHVDGNVLWALRADMTSYYEYTQVTINMDAYTDGGQHTIGLAGYSMEGASIIFDAFNLVVDGQNQVAVNELLNREQPITCYPNPANDKYNVRFNSGMEGVAVVQVTDINGRIVDATTLNNIYNGTFELNTLPLENGIYTMTVQNAGQVYTKRFVVSH